MNLRALIDAARERLDDQVEPYRWSDSTLTDHINEAEREACDRARLLYDDATPDVCTVAVVSGTARYTLDSRVLQVDCVYSAARKRTLERTTQHDLDATQYAWRTRSGNPLAFFEEENFIQLDRTPVADDTLTLNVWRLPLESMDVASLAGTPDAPEIHALHHERLIDWVLFRCYGKRDADSYDANAEALAEARFTQSFGERRDANVQRKQRRKQSRIVRVNW